MSLPPRRLFRRDVLQTPRPTKRGSESQVIVYDHSDVPRHVTEPELFRDPASPVDATWTIGASPSAVAPSVVTEAQTPDGPCEKERYVRHGDTIYRRVRGPVSPNEASCNVEASPCAVAPSAVKNEKYVRYGDVLVLRGDA